MKNKLFVKTLESLFFTLIASYIMIFLHLISCNSNEEKISLEAILDRRNADNADSLSLDSLTVLVEDSTAQKNDSLLTQFSHSLPIVKISIEEKYLWSDDSGLFVVDHPVLWEFPSQVMYIDENDTIFDYTLGLRLKGNYSIKLPNRSMGLYWRQKYGEKKINYNFFKNYDLSTFKRLKLRNGGTDASQLLTKDAVLSKLIGGLRNVEVANSRAVEVFINDHYWGLYNLRELITPRHFYYKYGLDFEQIIILESYPIDPKVDDGAKRISNNSLTFS